jgi:putative transposase
LSAPTKKEVLLLSDQGSQYYSQDCINIMAENNLKPAISKHGNCHDNVVAENYSQNSRNEL